MSKSDPNPASSNLKFAVKVQYILETIGLYLISGLVRMLPITFGTKLFGKMWRLFAPFNRRHKRALENLRLAMPEIDAANREKTIRDMWEMLGRVAAETVQLDRITNRSDLFVFDTEDAAQKFREFGGNGGSVLVSLHSGNWELAVLPALHEGWEACGVYQSLKNPQVDKFLFRRRQPQFKVGLYSKSDETAKKMMTAVRSGKAAAIIADLREKRGVKVNFFGRPAFATNFPAMLARTLNVPLIACRAKHRSKEGFLIEARMIDIPRDGDRKADIIAGTQAMHDVFEEWIRENPSQWMWIHRKWDYA